MAMAWQPASLVDNGCGKGVGERLLLGVGLLISGFGFFMIINICMRNRAWAKRSDRQNYTGAPTCVSNLCNLPVHYSASLGFSTVLTSGPPHSALVVARRSCLSSLVALPTHIQY